MTLVWDNVISFIVRSEKNVPLFLFSLICKVRNLILLKQRFVSHKTGLLHSLFVMQFKMSSLFKLFSSFPSQLFSWISFFCDWFVVLSITYVRLRSYGFYFIREIWNIQSECTIKKEQYKVK